MLTFQAGYHKGVLKPKIKLDLPEDAVVQVQVTPVPQSTLFGALKGIWCQLPESEIEQAVEDLAAARKLSADKVSQAEALRNKATLITRDGAITASGLVPVIW
jgi:predicted DNA-binding antitoxin AbrB/MazE fold protein